MKVAKINVRYKYVTGKLDGHFTEIRNSLGFQVITRRPTNITDQVVGLRCFQPYIDLPDTVYAELWYPGKQSDYIKTAINNQDDSLELSVFRVAGMEGKGLNSVQNYCDRHGLNMVPWAKWNDLVMPDPRPKTYPQLCRKMFSGSTTEPLKQHQEGLVFCDEVTDEPVKWKETKTIDLVCCGYVEGKGQHYGLVGSIECETADGTSVATCGGLNLKDRLDVSDNREKCIGRVLEVAYDKISSKGRLKFPRFLRWRDDKDRSECTLDQDCQLKDYYDNQNNED